MGDGEMAAVAVVLFGYVHPLPWQTEIIHICYVMLTHDYRDIGTHTFIQTLSLSLMHTLVHILSHTHSHTHTLTRLGISLDCMSGLLPEPMR